MKKIFEITFCIFGAFVASQFPNYKHVLVRQWVDSRIVQISDEFDTHGGTGVHVKAKSGKTYILTNGHICAMGRVFVSRNQKIRLERTVIKVSGDSDLCLIEPLPHVTGLEFSSSGPMIGDPVSIVGHPFLMHLYESPGQILNIKSIDVFDLSEDTHCKERKNIIKHNACFIRVIAYEATNLTYPGNSGSPVIDEDGKLLALVFADDVQTHWGFFITWSDINMFLKDF